MKKHIPTILLVLLGVGLGVGTSLSVIWPVASRHMARAALARQATEKAKVPEKPWDFWTVEMENLANDLRDERARVKQHEEQLAQREARLLAERQELEKTRKQIEELRIEIDRRLIEVAADEMANLKKLAQTYAMLQPKAAVAIFREMDDVMLVKIISLMKPETVSSLFAEMSKASVSDPALAKRAAALSERLRMVKTSKKAALAP